MLTKNIPYTFNRGGYFYFSRRVPSDLLHHYSYPRIVQGLRTKSQQTAKTRALVAAAKLDERGHNCAWHMAMSLALSCRKLALKLLCIVAAIALNLRLLKR